jgi:hypothetical protein
MKKAIMNTLKMKAVMMVFFDISGVIMIKWVPEGQTVNQKYYLKVLTKLQERVRRKKLWVLHQDNASAHNTLAVRQFLADKCTPVLDPPLPPSTGFSPL